LPVRKRGGEKKALVPRSFKKSASLFPKPGQKKKGRASWKENRRGQVDNRAPGRRGRGEEKKRERRGDVDLRLRPKKKEAPPFPPEEERKRVRKRGRGHCLYRPLTASPPGKKKRRHVLAPQKNPKKKRDQGSVRKREKAGNKEKKKKRCRFITLDRRKGKKKGQYGSSGEGCRQARIDGSLDQKKEKGPNLFCLYDHQWQKIKKKKRKTCAAVPAGRSGREKWSGWRSGEGPPYYFRTKKRKRRERWAKLCVLETRGKGRGGREFDPSHTPIMKKKSTEKEQEKRGYQNMYCRRKVGGAQHEDKKKGRKGERPVFFAA